MLKRKIKIFFEQYYKFFKHDVRYSLITVRDMNIILLFQIVFNEWIIEDSIDSNYSLNSLKNLIEDYKNKFEILFGITIKLDKKIKDDIGLDIETIKKIWDEYYKVYYIKTENSEYTVFEHMLIEVNNAFSHMLMSFLNGKDDLNIDRAISHLYRATIDGYKDLIKENIEFLFLNQSLMNDFFKIRDKEAEKIGKKSLKGKLDIIHDYNQLIINILTIKNSIKRN